jgi:hypothetical protein
MQIRESVIGYAAKSKIRECATLSVIEAELVAVTNCIQDMLYIRNVIESIGLKSKNFYESGS